MHVHTVPKYLRERINCNTSSLLQTQINPSLAHCVVFQILPTLEYDLKPGLWERDHALPNQEDCYDLIGRYQIKPCAHCVTAGLPASWVDLMRASTGRD